LNVWFGLVDAATSRSLRFTGWEKNRKMNSDTDRSESLIDVAYDAKLMRECGRRLVDVLSDHLQRVQAGMSSVQDWRDPEENIAKAKELLGDQTSLHSNDLPARFDDLIRISLERGQNLNHPRCVGHQVPAPLPLVGLFDAITTMTNQVQGVYEMGPWGIAAERAVMDLIGQQIGYQSGEFGGLVTSGGSLGNLTALLAARNEACPWMWNGGAVPNAGDGEVNQQASHSDRLPVLLVQADAHYSIERAAGVMGIGTSQVRRVPLDAGRRMDLDSLQKLLERMRVENVPVIAVVAVACTTAVGAFDPLDPIADLCTEYGVWLHVDAAHGGAVCLSRQHRHLVKGLHRADSVVLDAHKMMFVPAVCALVFYKNPKHRFRAFEQSAPYLFDPSVPDMSEYDNGRVTFECTKRSAALGLWGTLAIFGTQLFEQLVDHVFAMAQGLASLLAESSDFELFAQPSANMVVFRYLPPELESASDQQLNQLQLRLRRAMLDSGFAYLTQTSLDGRIYLRCTLMNPLTGLSHLEQIVNELARLGPEIPVLASASWQLDCEETARNGPEMKPCDQE